MYRPNKTGFAHEHGGYIPQMYKKSQRSLVAMHKGSSGRVVIRKRPKISPIRGYWLLVRRQLNANFYVALRTLLKYEELLPRQTQHFKAFKKFKYFKVINRPGLAGIGLGF